MTIAHWPPGRARPAATCAAVMASWRHKAIMVIRGSRVVAALMGPAAIEPRVCKQPITPQRARNFLGPGAGRGAGGGRRAGNNLIADAAVTE